MIHGASVLAVIPARGGSRGVARKNIRMVAGKPLLAWTIEAARGCPEIDRLVLSSEDAEIIAIARQWGCECPFPRPPELAADHTLAIDVALHLLATLPERYDYLVWLQPTAPLRTAQDITDCLELCVREGADSCVTVTPAEKPPWWMFFVDEAGAMRPVLPGDHTRANRQDLPRAHLLNGAVLVARTDWLQRSARFMDAHTRALVMPPERSLDIDSERDLLVAEWLLSRSFPGTPCASASTSTTP
ncbi:MAG: acylneuraminate cytidylyltransferase family protein [Magnetococcales bacterium]|nr:acylneuraminate cytidylyltransferase family protein [Magnetococcales bacterium]